MEPVRQAQPRGDGRRQVAALRAGGGEDDLRPLVQGGAGVIQRIDGRSRVKMQVARPVDALEEVGEEGRDIVDIQSSIILIRDDEQIHRE